MPTYLGNGFVALALLERVDEHHQRSLLVQRQKAVAAASSDPLELLHRDNVLQGDVRSIRQRLDPANGLRVNVVVPPALVHLHLQGPRQCRVTATPDGVHGGVVPRAQFVVHFVTLLVHFDDRFALDDLRQRPFRPFHRGIGVELVAETVLELGHGFRVVGIDGFVSWNMNQRKKIKGRNEKMIKKMTEERRKKSEIKMTMTKQTIKST